MHLSKVPGSEDVGFWLLCPHGSRIWGSQGTEHQYIDQERFLLMPTHEKVQLPTATGLDQRLAGALYSRNRVSACVANGLLS